MPRFPGILSFRIQFPGVGAVQGFDCDGPTPADMSQGEAPRCQLVGAARSLPEAAPRAAMDKAEEAARVEAAKAREIMDTDDASLPHSLSEQTRRQVTRPYTTCYHPKKTCLSIRSSSGTYLTFFSSLRSVSRFSILSPSLRRARRVVAS